MKKIVTVAAAFMLSMGVFAQAPQKMSYQAVVRNASNSLITSSPIGMRISILQGSSTGTAVYVETQTATTNANGLATIEIGIGSVVSGTFATINWANGPYFIKTETDPNGGTAYTITGTTQLMSVPYALYAEKSGTPGPQGVQGLPGTNGTNGLKSLVNTTAVASGTDCATGGTKIESGIDTDNDGTLQAGEVTSTRFVCNGSNGANGTNGLKSLVNTTAVASGTDCATGGSKIESGVDTDNDGILQAGEVTFTQFVCNGSNGANGTNGTNGLKSLVNTTAIASGTDCATGGTKIESGIDTDNDGTLQAGEVTSTRFVCNGATGATGATGAAGPIAGSDKQIIFNNAGVAGASSNLTWDNVSNKLFVTGVAQTSSLIVTGLGGAGNRMLITDNAGVITTTALPAGITGTGTNNYHVKWTTAGSVIGNSLIQDNGTSISAGNATPSSIYQMYVYRQQLTANGDGQSTLMGYRNRDSQNDGTAYSQFASNTGVTGHSFWGDQYSFGVGGWNYNDFSRCGGVIGGEINANYWGALGYKNSATVTFGVYGSNAYGSGSGFAPTEEAGGIGGGFFGMVGTMSRGSVIGQLNAGELFATYNMGDVYTSGKNVELVNSNNEVLPTYAVTSTEATTYNKGKAQLVNGTARITFDESYSKLLGENPVVTITPMGECNGVYIVSVDKTGFTVKELNSGHSTVDIAWIAVGTRIDAKTNAVPEFVKSTSFNASLDKALFNDSNTSQSAEGIWWDGKTLQFNSNFPESLNSTREQKMRKAGEKNTK